MAGCSSMRLSSDLGCSVLIAPRKSIGISNLRVLVLDAGPFLVSEHVQNLARIGLNVPGAASVPNNASDPGTRELVWGLPWRTQVPFAGLAYCVGGRSLYWGGWSPRLTTDDLLKWPNEVAGFLQSLTGKGDAYEATERETGVFDKTDYISGPLNDDLKRKATLPLPALPRSNWSKMHRSPCRPRLRHQVSSALTNTRAPQSSLTRYGRNRQSGLAPLPLPGDSRPCHLPHGQMASSPAWKCGSTTEEDACGCADMCRDFGSLNN